MNELKKHRREKIFASDISDKNTCIRTCKELSKNNKINSPIKMTKIFE